jgi:hypothetical protein
VPMPERAFFRFGNSEDELVRTARVTWWADRRSVMFFFVIVDGGGVFEPW